MKIKLSNHALSRAKERSIDLKYIEGVLKDPSDTIEILLPAKSEISESLAKVLA